MFKGQFNHTIDSKGRLIVPAKFREQLGEEFVVTKGFDGCLYAYSMTEWEKIEARFTEMPLTTKDARKLTRFFFSGAASCEVDRQGRILIPAVLRNFAGLQKDVVLAGVLNRIEIWSAEAWNEQCEYDEQEMDEAAEHVFEMGLGI